MSIRIHYQNELNELNEKMLKMAALVEESMDKAMDSLVKKDVELAKEVIEFDPKINEMELAIEDDCTVLIAREAPVAQDLRQVVTILKIVTQLERMADHAVHIAKRTIELKDEEYIKPLIDLPQMAQLGNKNLHDAISAYIEKNPDRAEDIAKKDKRINELHDQVTREIFTYTAQNMANFKQATVLLFISRFLERYGDHVTNICEWIIYTYTGKHVEL